MCVCFSEDWTDVGELGGEWAGESEEDWTGELVYLVSVCKRVFSVGFGPGLDSAARCWRSASYAVGSHGWLPPENGARA